MHPKAAALALAGLVPFRYSGTTNVRFMRIGFKDRDRGLRLRHCVWQFLRCDEPSAYQQVEWDSVPDAMWDALPDELLQRAIQGD